MKLVDIEKLNKALSEAERHHGAFDKLRKSVNDPMLNISKALENNLALKRMLDDVERPSSLIKSAMGPLEELRKGGAFDLSSPLLKDLQRTQRLMAEYEKRFSLPELNATAKLLQDFQNSPMSDVLKRYSEQASEVQRAMENMRTPWLDAQQALKSVGGFAELQGIGSILERFPTFDDKVSATLRIDLGDWRDKIVWPEKVLTNLGARSEFYVNLGFDQSLTDFPAPAFEEATEIAGLRRAPPPLVSAYGTPVPHSANAEEEGALVRTNIAHDRLFRLETNLRKFIDDKMTQEYGPDWPRHRLPPELYEKWVEKKSKAESSGRETRSLVSYADFTDYERVICKKDNWRDVFKSFFGRIESVRESFQRLHPIRLDTMHARPIGQDDELLLYVEVQRLIRAIDI